MTATATDLNAAFITAAFEGLPGTFELRGFDPDEQRPPEQRWFASPTQLFKEAMQLSEKGLNACYGVASRRDRESGKAENLQAARVLFVDVDDVGNDDEKRERLKMALKDFKPKPSAVFNSGNGAHLLWLLHDPLDLTDHAVLDAYRHALRGLCDALGGDPGCKDPARVLRVPGAINYPSPAKREKGCVVVGTRMEVFEAERRYSLDDFDPFIERSKAMGELVEAANYTSLPPGTPMSTKIKALVSKNTKVKARFERQGDGLDDPSESGIDFSLAVLLAKHGVSAAEIELALRHSRADAALPQKPDSYFTRTVGKATALVEREAEQDLHADAGDHLRLVKEDEGHQGDDGGEVEDQDDVQRSDTGNAKRLVRLFAPLIRNHAGQWFVWDGRRFKVDGTPAKPGKAMLRLAMRSNAELVREIADMEGGDEKKRWLAWARQCEDARRLRDMVSVAATFEEISVESADEFDANPMLLNVLNGVLDLATGELLPHDPALMMTKLAPVEFDPDADPSVLLRFIEEIQPDADNRAYLQRALGYAMSGEVGEQKLFLPVGEGSNGKSTLFELIRDTLGDYAGSMSSDTILMPSRARDPNAPRNDLAALVGKRLVIVTEIEKERERKLHEPTVKSLAGGDTIVCRRNYGDVFEFRPRAKFFVANNELPIVKSTNKAIWRRLRPIPFPVIVPDEDVDPLLPQKLDAHRSALLNWLLEGCISWKRDGLGGSAQADEVLGEYREEQDTIGRFIRERITMAPDLWVATAKLKAASDAFFGELGLSIPWDDVRKRIQRLPGVTPKRRHAGAGWLGIVLTEDSQGEDWTQR